MAIHVCDKVTHFYHAITKAQLSHSFLVKKNYNSNLLLITIIVPKFIVSLCSPEYQHLLPSSAFDVLVKQIFS